MTDVQQAVCRFLMEDKGYIIERAGCWPLLRNPETGTLIQVAFDGRQVEAGYEEV